jgi:CheY-like chemotaxis protein
LFLNLIVNAAQAIPEGNAGGNVLRVATRVDGSGRIVVSVSDTGSGIAPRDLQQLFQPFYTTKAPGLGTGLGLAISHRIITNLGGEIRVESQLGEGTTFHVFLPAARTCIRPVEARRPTGRAARRARVLVVDDEPMMANAIRRTLAAEHDVVVVVRASEALELVRAGEAFDIILCDLMMPQMTGMELHAELTALGSKHAQTMIFLTGGAFTQSARAFLDTIPNHRVEKPFDPQQLRALLNERTA